MPTGPHCADCHHRPLGVRFIPPDGTTSSGILFVGDSPWQDEMREGKPFAGAAGYTFNNWLRMLSLQRIDVMTSNALWCKPARLHWTDYPNRYPDAAAALDHCRPHLDDLIERIQPKVIVPMGNVALRRVCGISGIEASASYVLSTPYGIPAVPTYHPSFVMQGKQKLTAACVFAINRARSIAHGTYQPSQYELLLDPPPDRARAYLASAGRDRIPHLVVDIETPESDRLDEEEFEQEGVSWNIVRAGFSLRQGTAITFPWQQPYISILQEALDRADEFIEHADNRFDSRRLAAAGLRLPARIVSSMWAWHFLESDLRKGLGLVAPFYYGGPPWKDQNAARPAWYNAMDNAVTMDVYLGTRRILIDQGRWQAFERHCVKMSAPYYTMGSRGLDVDVDAQSSFMRRIEEEWDATNARLQAAVPGDIKPRKFWKRPPKDMTGVIELPNPHDLAGGNDSGVEGAQ